MKAYAVVRKPQPSNKTISHTFKLQNKNPEISIDPIQENRSLTPRKAEFTLPEHLIRTSSKHFKVQESFTQVYVPSKSPARKHPIFNQMISQFMETKMRKESESKLNSQKLNESINESIYEKRSMNFSKASEQKLESSNKVQRKQMYSTPQKVMHKNNQHTPYDLLNSSERERQVRPLSINRKNRIFEQYRNTSKQRRVNYPQPSQDKSYTFKRSIGHQLELLQQKSHQISNSKPIHQRQTAPHIFGALRSSKNDHVIEEDLSCSQVNIGCCGQQIKQRSISHYTPKNEVVSNRIENFQKRENAIINSLGPQFLAFSQQKNRSKSRRKIFNHVNPQLKKSNKQIQNYKQDKIKAKPLFTQPKPKQLKVVVFEINSYPPFEF